MLKKYFIAALVISSCVIKSHATTEVIDIYAPNGYAQGTMSPVVVGYACYYGVEFWTGPSGTGTRVGNYGDSSPFPRPYYEPYYIYDGKRYYVKIQYESNIYGLNALIRFQVSGEDPNGDIDGDGIPDSEDSDIDGDGLDNSIDPFPEDADGDLDGDGIPDNEDDDRDGDGLKNTMDPSPNNATGDFDGDGIDDIDDSDADGDGLSYYDDPDDTVPNYDYDGDGIPNNQDDDIDGDGIPNEADVVNQVINNAVNNSTVNNAFSGGTGSAASNGSSAATPYTNEGAIEGNVYVENLDGVETSLKAIREGLSQRLDKNLSDVVDPITDISQISEQTLEELRELGISSDQAVTYLNDMNISLADLLEHQNDTSATQNDLLGDIKQAINDQQLSAVSSNSVQVTVTNDIAEIESTLNGISNLLGVATAGNSNQYSYVDNSEEIDSSEFENQNQSNIDSINEMGVSSHLKTFSDGIKSKMISMFTIDFPDLGKSNVITFALPSFLGLQLPPLQVDTSENQFLVMLRHILVICLGITSVRYCMSIFNATFQ